MTMPKQTFQVLAISALLLCCSFPAIAADPLVFANQEQESRFQALTEELRCLVCQNQNLADSDAPLAQDLRKEIHSMLLAGKSDDEIRSFLVERYGDFVLYRPPLKGNTLLLWLTPVLLLMGGGLVVAWNVRRHRMSPETETSGQEDIPEDKQS